MVSTVGGRSSRNASVVARVPVVEVQHVGPVGLHERRDGGAERREPVVVVAPAVPVRVDVRVGALDAAAADERHPPELGHRRDRSGAGERRPRPRRAPTARGPTRPRAAWRGSRAPRPRPPRPGGAARPPARPQRRPGRRRGPAVRARRWRTGPSSSGQSGSGACGRAVISEPASSRSCSAAASAASTPTSASRPCAADLRGSCPPGRRSGRGRIRRTSSRVSASRSRCSSRPRTSRGAESIGGASALASAASAVRSAVTAATSRARIASRSDDAHPGHHRVDLAAEPHGGQPYGRSRRTIGPHSPLRRRSSRVRLRHGGALRGQMSSELDDPEVTSCLHLECTRGTPPTTP